MPGAEGIDKLTVRRARTPDCADIARLTIELGYPAVEDKIERRLPALLGHRDHCVLVAQFHDRVVGLIHGFRTLRVGSDPFVEIGGLVVSASHQRLGVGRALVEELKLWAGEQGVTSLRVRCQAWRMEAHAFYLALGFNETKTQKVFDLT